MTSSKVERARRLRRDQTEAERRLWNCLRNRGMGGLRWKRQVPVPPYYVDFLCPELGLVVELDGGQHSFEAAKDEQRSTYLRAQGLKVIRF